MLGRGIKFLFGALPLCFIGPVVLYSSFHNQEHPLFIPILILGTIAFFAAIFLMFKGITTIVKAVFD